MTGPGAAGAAGDDGPPPSPPGPEQLARTARTARDAAGVMAAWLELQRLQARVPGVQAAVRVGEELVLSVALGAADEAVSGEPLTTAHRFRVASHSKAFTAAAVALLVQQGRLRVDDPAARWVPGLAERAPALADVTVRQLLAHRGGLGRDGASAEHWQLGAPFPPDAEALLEAVAHGGLPGRGGAVYGADELFKYSNLGFGLLGRVVEEVTGTTWAEHLRTALLEPLGLGSTLPDAGGGDPGPWARGHIALLPGDERRCGVGPVGEPQGPATGALAAGTGVASTAEDLSAFFAALCDGAPGPLDGRSRRLLRRREAEVPGRSGAPERSYGLGLERRELAGRQLVGHGGGFPGQTTRTWADPAARVVVSVLTSAGDGPADLMATGLLRLLDVALAGPGAGSDGGPGAERLAALERCTGRFANLWGVLDVALLGGRLVLLHPRDADPAASRSELVLDDDGALRALPEAGFGPVGERVELRRDGDGRVASVRWGGLEAWPLPVWRARRAEQAAGGLSTA